MAAAGPINDQLKKMLKSAVQSVQWTYIIYWPICPQQRILVWGDGYYNGAIKTRKIVQSMEETSFSRSDQLKELYDRLSSSNDEVTVNQQPLIRRPLVTLSPEDLTDSEWFYLMSISYSFPPGVGLVGEAYAKHNHRWLARPNEANSKVFTRAILAKSARIEMVVCIPILNGIIELGTTRKVEEDVEFVRRVKLFFTDNNSIYVTMNLIENAFSMDEYDIVYEEDEEEDEEEEDKVNGWDVEAKTCHISSVDEPKDDTMMDANELLQIDMHKDIRFGLPNECLAGYSMMVPITWTMDLNC